MKITQCYDDNFERTVVSGISSNSRFDLILRLTFSSLPFSKSSASFSPAPSRLGAASRKTCGKSSVAGFNSSTSSIGQVSSQGANSNMSPTQSASPSNPSGQEHFRDLIFLPPSVPQGLVQSLQLQYSPHEHVVDAHGRSLSSAQGSTDFGHGESHSLFSQTGGHGVPSSGQDSSGQRHEVGLSVTELSVAAGVLAGVTLMNSGSMVGSQLLSGHSLSQLPSGHSGSGHPSSHSGSAVDTTGSQKLKR